MGEKLGQAIHVMMSGAYGRVKCFDALALLP